MGDSTRLVRYEAKRADGLTIRGVCDRWDLRGESGTDALFFRDGNLAGAIRDWAGVLLNPYEEPPPLAPPPEVAPPPKPRRWWEAFGG